MTDNSYEVFETGAFWQRLDCVVEEEFCFTLYICLSFGASHLGEIFEDSNIDNGCFCQVLQHVAEDNKTY